MKKRLLWLLLPAIVLPLLFNLYNDTPSDGRPAPTQIREGEEEGKSDAREAWIEAMHRSAPGTDWKSLEYQTQMARQRGQLETRNDCSEGTVAEGWLSGSWAERGSNNQAGSVFDIAYDPTTDELWLLSAGGSLFQGDLDGSSWAPVNQALRFNQGMLEFIDGPEGRRMLAFAGRIPHYSDDDGHTWTPATGIAHADSWGTSYSPKLVSGENQAVFVLAKPDYWTAIKLYRSDQNGENYEPVHTFSTHETGRLALSRPHHTESLWAAEKTEQGSAQLFQVDTGTGELTPAGQAGALNFGSARANLQGYAIGDSLILYAYAKPADAGWQVLRSTDGGSEWEVRGELPASPWEVGLFISPENPDHLYMGEVEAHRSLDGGATWAKINDWWAYYDDVANTLHADIMRFSAFRKADSTAFTLVSNHGGLSVSYDNLETVQNIGLAGLNVSQYYSVRTDPTNSRYVYAGSQDQGFQRSRDFDEPGIPNFNQVISGDYGHIVFSNEGEELWTVYPGGWVTYYRVPKTGNLTASWEVISADESVWLPPLLSSPFPADNAVYLAGGNADGGPGSYLIRLEPTGQEIQASQSDFDFKSASAGGELTALAASSLDYNYWYTATSNGRFFYSADGGFTWEQSLNFLPEGHYLYGQAIHASTTQEGMVLLGGSGYSNPAVYRSDDHGANFTPMSAGLPPTMVFDLAATPDEQYFFAATEAGPYVYPVEAGQWFYMGGDCAPAQTYWSVEYVEADQTVRFGTYGRGIWDFQLNPEVSVAAVPAPPAFRFGPNPAQEWVDVQLPEGQWDVTLTGQNGRIVQVWKRQSRTARLSLPAVPGGLYALQIQNASGQMRVQKLVIAQ